MRFPLVTRSRHEQEVSRLTDQIRALAKLLYPQGVPEEFQLLLGVRIDTAERETAEPERSLTDDEKMIAEMKAEQERDQANLARIKRTRPSLLGAEIARHMKKWGGITVATPAKTEAAEVFSKAEAEALRQVSA